MPLTVITGRANAGKTGKLYAVVRKSAAAGGLPVVVLPARPDARRAAEEFAAQGPCLGVRTVTADALIDDLWAAHGDGRQIVGDTQRRILLRRVVAQEPLEAVGRSATRRGFVSLLEGVVRSADAVSPPSSRRGSVTAEIARLVSAYQELLASEGLIERTSAVTTLAQHMAARWFDGPIVLNRFTDLTATQEALVVTLSRFAEVWLSLPWSRDFPATRALDDLVGRLEQVGASIEEVPPQRHTRSDELAYLEEHLFMPPEKAIGAIASGDVRLSQAFGEEAEADRIAAEVCAALAEGTEPSRISVVFRDPAQHVAALRRALTDARVDAHYDVMEPAWRTGLGRSLMHLADFGRSGARSDLIAFARTRHSGVSRAAVERAEAYWLRTRTAGGSPLLAELGRLGGEAPRMIRMASALMRAEIDAGVAKEWKSLADWMLANGLRRADASTNELLRDAAAHRAFTRVLSELAVLPQARFTGGDVIEAFLEERITADPGDGDGLVQVMSAQRARARRFDVVIVGGLTSGDFPPRQTENALSSAEMVAALRDAGVDIRRGDEQDVERLLFYLTVSRATKRLVLSRQVADSEGRELRPSWLLDELLDLYRPPGEESCATPIPPVSTLAFEENALGPSAPPSTRRRLRTAILGSGIPETESERRRVTRAVLRPARTRRGLTDERLLERLRTRDSFSVTEVESYLACPYAWFYEREVRARPLGQDVDASVSGQLIHTALERFYRALPERIHDSRVTPTTAEKAIALAAEVVREVLAEQPEPRSVDERAAFATVRRKVCGFIAAEATMLPGFAVALTEVPFDTRESGIELGVDFSLKGRVDRIDRGAQDEAIVIDYKSGRVGSEYGQAGFEKHRRVQMPLYSLIVGRLLGGPVVGGLYRGVSPRNLSDKMNRGFFEASRLERTGLVSTDAVDTDAIRALEGEALARAAEAVAGIRAGRIEPAPANAAACAYCGARGFCGEASA